MIFHSGASAHNVGATFILADVEAATEKEALSLAWREADQRINMDAMRLHVWPHHGDKEPATNCARECAGNTSNPTNTQRTRYP